MIGPVDLLRMPADGLTAVRRLLDEVIAMRMLLEHVSGLVERDLEELKRDVAPEAVLDELESEKQNSGA